MISNAARILPLALDAPTDDVVVLDELLHQVDGDVALLRELIALFLASYPERLARLDAALADRDAPALELVAHSLRGSAYNFCAVAAAAAAARLEIIACSGNLTRADEAAAGAKYEYDRLADALRAIT
ncbi:MAG: Hpt domain-containing protein [Deltaproteobacteria bacterium]|nr:Hpt domain-containing protein [Deltaproteobacteria bacterium]MBI3388480.1 Hpt domain-containing protein [Deltaproteobacteria bacterium]